MSTTNVTLPRPLKNGEFYCHLCEKFVPLAKHSEHQKECRNQVRKERGK